jgi:ophiobolin F synthase
MLHCSHDPGYVLIRQVVLEPYDFLSSLPTKGNGNALSTSLNVWYNIPENKLQPIRDVVNTTIQASLMYVDPRQPNILRHTYQTGCKALLCYV